MSSCTQIDSKNGSTLSALQDKKEYSKEEIKGKYGDLVKESDQKANFCSELSSKEDATYSLKLGYTEEDMSCAPQGANLGLGCGNPTVIASLKEGERVLDLGSGAGFDAFLAVRKVGKSGHVVGVDMTQAMIDKATANAKKGGYENVEFLLGEIEDLPLPSHSIDVIISNCVINLSTNKPKVFEEAFRVLKSGGRISISDLVALHEIPQVIKESEGFYSDCMAGATLVEDIRFMLDKVGFIDVAIEIQEESKKFIKDWTSDVTLHIEDFVSSAVIRAVKP